MPHIATDPRMGEPDLGLMRKLAVAERFCLTAATVIAALNLLGWLEPSLREFFRGGSRPMNVEAAIAVLLCAASLHLLRPRTGQRKPTVAVVLTTLATAGSAMVLFGHVLHATSLISHAAHWITRGMTPHAASCFVLGGIATLLIRARGGVAGVLADIAAIGLAFVVITLAMGHLIGVLSFFGPTSTFTTSAQTMLCLVLLVVPVLIRRAEQGAFSILLGRGIGSKVARVLTPLMIVLPYLREGLRAHLFSLQQMPAHYTTSFLATAAVFIAMALVMYLAWRLNELEAEIQGLSLRDPLTGLNNLRGFRLLAEQTLLMAYRSGQPFSVLFIDLDNLKIINDALGHQAGSDFLAATADILRENLRETDVLGRIGGDEFAVAGQFSRTAIAEVARRLRREAALRDVKGASIPLSLSIGSVTSSGHKRETLTELLARADEEMYRNKRQRKEAAKRQAEQSGQDSAPGLDTARIPRLEQS